ncbi:PH and SEC7 domain-containing protein-like [Biomphalaria glabrata]|uniref:PH and SEC7 domain-containing protein-like n=1 Tax=Biomphalaria glabrata TaxID=6526 RepID=A0A9W2ZP45_BIOGL|nr:PH and SEC7 domain-containing protein-like [Biomphalaria glabrata]
MASRATKSPSLIPLPVRTPSSPPAGPHVTAIFVKDISDEQNSSNTHSPKQIRYKKENGNLSNDKQDHLQSPHNTSGKGFETFLMTGEMIIRTNSPVTQKHARLEPEVKSKESHIPRLAQGDQKQQQQQKVSKPQQQNSTITSPKLTSKIPGPVKSQHHPSSPNQNHIPFASEMAPTVSQCKDFPFVHAPVAEMEELSDLSQSSCSESEFGLGNGSTTVPSSLPDYLASSSSENITLRLGETAETLDNSNSKPSDALFSEPPSSGDSGFALDGHISESDLRSNNYQVLSKDENFVSDETLTDKEDISENNFSDVGRSGKNDIQRPIVASSSGEKFSVHGGGERLLVRTSKSHENYLQAGTGIALVSIDIEDNLAYSLDTLTYHDSSNSSLDNVTSEPVQTSRSLDNSPEKKNEKSTIERDFVMEDTKPVKLKLVKQKDDEMFNHHNNQIDYQRYEANNSGNFSSAHHQATPSSPSQKFIALGRFKEEEKSVGDNILENHCGDPLQLSVLSDDSDSDSLYHQPSKAVDRPSAERLAKRLFNLEGFRKSDVSRHLCKKNDFSNLVAEEYLKYFDFNEDTLDQALRKFLTQFSLYGETQERERVLAHFSRRFMECNPGSFNSEDACHTLTCAIMLLNSDLHAPNVGRRMTCQEFIENLAELNDGENFSKEVLKAIYQAIKNEPIEWAVDELPPELEGVQLQDSMQSVPTPSPQSLGSNPFLEVPDPNKTTEYKKGYVMRKCCVEPDRRRTPFGKRGWKMLYAVLRDMILYQYKDEHQIKKGHFVESSHNAIRIHHALATKATDYTKKQHVFRLQTADGAEYLFQTGDSKELQEWLDTINLVAASLSAPPLPGAVGSKGKFQRQLLPSTYTRLNLREQLHSHDTKVQELEQELHFHRAAAPEKGAKSSVIQDYLDKEIYLEYELKRFKTYSYLLLGKLSAFPELEPSLVETTIGEYEEMGAGPSRAMPMQTAIAKHQGGVTKPVQRSLSDSFPTDLEGTPTLRRAPVINTLTECTRM